MVRRLLPEWAPLDGVMITWPHSGTDWEPYLDQIEPLYVNVAAVIARYAELLIVCHDKALEQRVRGLLEHLPPNKLHFALAKTNDTWARDHGPISVSEDGRLKMLDFQFNAWGGKYKADDDNLINARIADQGVFKPGLSTAPFELEGGAIETDGLGTLLTTRANIYSGTRNLNLSQDSIESELKRLLGVDRILMLSHGHLSGDDTDSHIDTLARFCDEHSIAYVSCNDPADEHYAELKMMEDELKALRDRDGNPYRLFALPWPKPKFNEHGDRLPATYANFLICNAAVLVPTYDDAADEEALKVMRTVFPNHEIVAVPCLPLILQYGSLHCMTMQLPEGSLK
ncbi:MAG TPA: agmatine deiminase family protein [Pseudomonadales bacterium]|nr:agmatine deiminase family protein [Pseudomonadales bacterium]